MTFKNAVLLRRDGFSHWEAGAAGLPSRPGRKPSLTRETVQGVLLYGALLRLLCFLPLTVMFYCQK